jgi:sialate O-acetylesterase
MPLIFGDNMVLQQDTKLPLWGTATPGEAVTVTFAGQTGNSVAAADGKWRVDLAPVSAGNQGQVLTVTGKNTLSFQDVLVGDVWVASGQSNMEFGIEADSRGADAIAKADDPQLRLFVVRGAPALEPQTDVAPTSPTSVVCKWEVCTPAFLNTKLGAHAFSAIGYYFAREIRRVTGKPVGVIGTYWGGTPAQAWTSISGLQKDPALAHYVETHQKLVDNFAAASAAYPQQVADFKVAYEKWNTDVGKAYTDAVTQWKTAAGQAKASGQPTPPQPVLSQPKPNAPTPPFGGSSSPTVLFNCMVAPIIPYAIKGVIWYQGESNTGTLADAQEYATLFPRMISDWREKWAQGDFPFLFVQLANLGPPPKTPSEGNWPWVRNAQLQALSLPNTGMATAVDIGNPTNIHPTDKLDVAMRLVLAARHLVYGEKDLVYSGPLYDTMTIEGNKIRLIFKNRGSGLTLGVPPWTPTGVAPPQPVELTGFGIAGTDQKFVWAKAVIDGDTIVVSSDQVPAPVAVRYDWSNDPNGDLYNKENLPAFPFRTDSWSN